MRKKKNVGFPNSIELTLLSGKREFFTSFLARGDAYRWVGAGQQGCWRSAPSVGRQHARPVGSPALHCIFHVQHPRAAR